MRVIIDEYIDKIEGFSKKPFVDQTKYLAYCYVKSTKDKLFSPKNISDFFEIADLQKPKNISDIFLKLSDPKRKNQIFIKKGDVYSFERTAFNEIETEFGKEGPSRKISATLRKLVSKIIDKQESDFLEEAITCFEVGAYRASIVLSWALTIFHLQNYIFNNKLAEFNASLVRQNLKLKKIMKFDDFSDIKESKFIEVCRSAKLISNDVRKILDEKLGTRNTYAHPNEIKVSESKATSFTEDLVENVILKYN